MNDDTIVIDGFAQDVLFRQARSESDFTGEPVDPERIRAVYELTKWAPTSFNQQPLRIALVYPGPARDRLVGLMSRGNRAEVAAAPLVAVLAADVDFHEHLPVLNPGPPIEEFGDPAVREESALVNGSLQAAFFILGVRAAGLTAGPMSGLDREGAAKEFFDGDHRVLMVVNIGRRTPVPPPPRLPRLAFEQVVRISR